jgi:two-component system, NtrC family, sensor kinase
VQHRPDQLVEALLYANPSLARLSFLPRRLSSRLADLHFLLPAFGILLLGGILGSALIYTNIERTAAQRSAVVSSGELLDTYEALVVRALREIDQTLKLIKYAHESNEGAETLPQLQQRDLVPPPWLFALTISDRNGDIRASTSLSLPGNVAGQDYFQAQRRGDELFVSAPLAGEKEGEWTLLFSRRLNARNGEFDGTVMLAVDAAYFVSSYEASRFGQHGVLALLGTDGIFRARRSGDAVVAGDRVDYASAVGGPTGGHPASPIVRSAWDGVPRYTSVRQLGGFPLAVIVGLAEDEQMVRARQHTRVYWFVAIAASVLLIIVLAALSRMSGRLARSRKREQEARLDIARQAGQAEVATNVLHNVGNALNSVNVAATLVTDSVRGSKVAGLARAVGVLREHADDLGTYLTSDPRGKHIPAYLQQLAEAMRIDQEASIRHLDSLQHNVDHIKQIVGMQQSLAKTSGLLEQLDLCALVDDSLTMNLDSLNRHGIELIREYAEVPPVVLDKHSVLQILLNLISNAKYACNDCERSDKRIVVSVLAEQGWIKLTVSDNGVGIEPANLTRIFNHGFTTRKLGHGFGLHSGALAAKQLGGSLTAHSDGAGRGAVFTLQLPLRLAKGQS